MVVTHRHPTGDKDFFASLSHSHLRLGNTPRRLAFVCSKLGILGLSTAAGYSLPNTFHSYVTYKAKPI